MAQQGEEHRNIAPQPQTEEGGINWLYMTPLLGAPLLPLVRIALRPYPKIRDVAFGTMIAFFLGHGAWLIGRGFDQRREQQNERIRRWEEEQRLKRGSY
ncbi:uncharacterized protein ACA1_384680 [Acanthamoeba castellanii str. Neff]|uniref:Uncharacterized protein n=1 Tax=Acanthamoeba castellanii (strain ATCC 30010 / Neff) TaxID=1257118 RepID=L8HAJ1_ACACF|nr:uncharacterized protein ACA1_384680 [Acanthamoeba castellanii str. Neff]ELR21733.1 hypothetical protein ACA1_384680 [Acanthamoeba castellanii str. Neff]